MSPRMSNRVVLAGLATLLSQASPAKVDFARDIQPLFEKHCYECHGPKQQKNGFRLDRRSRAMAGVVRANIIPGMSASSRVYRRVLDSDSGPQMPLEDTLTDQEIDTIRQWIDEGAHWPDELANEVDAPPPDQSAAGLDRAHSRTCVAAMRTRQAVLESIAREPRVINARGRGGRNAADVRGAVCGRRNPARHAPGRRQSQHHQRLGCDRADVGRGRSRQGDAAAGRRGQRECHLGIRSHGIVTGNPLWRWRSPRPNCCWRAAPNPRRRR